MLDVVRHILINNSDVLEVVSEERVICQVREQGGELPAIMISSNGIDPNNSKTFGSGIDDHSISVHVYAETWDEANALARACRAALDGFRGNVQIGSTLYLVDELFFTGESEDYYIDNESVSAIVYMFQVSEQRTAYVVESTIPSKWPVNKVINASDWNASTYVPMIGQIVFKNTGIGTIWPWVVGDGETAVIELPLETSGGGGSSVTWNTLDGKPDTFPPSAHTHAMSDVSGLDAALSGKANSTHSHAMSDVNGLDTALAGKANSTHSHAMSDVTGLSSALAAKADLVGGLVSPSQLPSIAITEFLGTVASESEMLALTGQIGDFCIRTDVSRTYVLTSANATLIGSWTYIVTPASPVNSVNGYTGTVVISKSDIGLSNVDNTSDANKPVSTAQAAAISAKQDALGFTPENAAKKGVANGYASLDGSGKVPSTQLPSFVDDVLEYANLASFPATGETGKIYVALDTNKTYRWSGSAYVEISPSPGSTDAVAEGSTNLYFTVARVLAAILADLDTSSATPITSADRLLSALGKLQAQISAKPSQDSFVCVSTVGTTIGASTTVYAAIGSTGNSTETTRQSAFTFNCTCTGMSVIIGSTQSATGSLVISLRLNATTQATAVTIAAGSAAGVYTTNTTTAYTAGQKIAIEQKNNATAASATLVTVSTEWKR